MKDKLKKNRVSHIEPVCQEYLDWYRQRPKEDWNNHSAFYDKAPMEYLMMAFAFRDKGIGIRMLGDFLVYVTNNVSVSETIKNGIRLFANPDSPKDDLENEYTRIRILIKNGEHHQLEKSLFNMLAWRLDYRDNNILPVAFQLAKSLLPEGTDYRKEAGKRIRKIASKQEYIDLVGDNFVRR